MLTIIEKSQFIQTPWKNGKGITTELAISEGGTLDSFDWRLSIATVSENGEFSDFSGIERNLFLIAGNGIELHHDLNGIGKTDRLINLLEYSSFYGASKTTGSLVDGEIFDLNLMTKEGLFHVDIHAVVEPQLLSSPLHIGQDELLFIYAPDITQSQQKLADLSLTTKQDKCEIARGNLIKLADDVVSKISGELFILIKLSLAK